MSTQLLPYSFARKNQVLVDKEGIFYCNSSRLTALAEAQCHATPPAHFIEVSEAEFSQRLNSLYEESSSDADLLEMELDDEDDLDLSVRAAEDILESDSEAPVIRLLNALFLRAIRASASDIHIEPYEHNLLVRYRIDGVLRDVLETNRSLTSKIVSRVKVMARLDIAERRVPQDGRISLRLGDRLIDIRVSTLPCSHGERVVMRLLSRSHEELDINQSGMSAAQLELFKTLISRPHGILLVTGPTGSGKTTTLYAGLNQIRDGRTNILTIEDPVEYDLKGVGQTQVNTNTGMTFARGLRAILRQDPDVVMVGEIRDGETAEISVQASLTGHLVLSTLHTNTAVGAIARLADMGIEPFLIASSLHGVLAQRLVRILCPHCKEAHPADEAVRRSLQIPAEFSGQIYRPIGCDKCEQTGYLGRTGVFEIIEIDEQTQQQIHENPGEWQINEKVNRATGTILENSRQLVLEGKTSAEEVLRVIQSSD